MTPKGHSTTEETQTRIILRARDRFFQMKGFSKVTMDEIARDLGMSKKTLYKFFPDKRALLRQVIDFTLTELRAGIEVHLQDKSRLFPARLQELLSFVARSTATFMNRTFLQDLQRFAPEIWRHIEKFREEMILTRFDKIIEQGIEAGHLRTELDKRVVVLVYMGAIQNIMNPKVLSELPLTSKQVFESIASLLMHGMLTEEARASFEDEK